MNYYERHIGDYSKNASHLSLLEHGIYVRLMDVYYTREAPIPDDKAARLIGAATPETLQALQDVLEEFFVLRNGLWHNDRCDTEIAVYTEGEPEREIKKANEDNRLKRHREERAELFRVLVNTGRHAPWNIGISELRKIAAECVAGVAVSGTSNAPATQPATAPATPATATHSPFPTPHSPLPSIQEKEITKLALGRARPPVAPQLSLVEGASAKDKGPPDCPHLEVLDLWAKQLPALPEHLASQWKGARADHLRTRWRETAVEEGWTTKEQGLVYFGRLFAYIGRSKFLTGNAPTSPGRSPFVITLAWLVKPENWAKTIEGNYHPEQQA